MINTKMAALVLCLAVGASLLAQEKQEERLKNSAQVLDEILSESNGLPKNILDQAVCVLIYPDVKKVGLGITGPGYGRGALVCRKGATMNGEWGAPAMYALNQSSLGVQLGVTETDFVLLVMNQKGAEQILNGQIKLGTNAASAAGPTGTQATSYSAESMNTDVLTYSRSRGLFAGVSLQGARMRTDKDGNKALYGKELSARQIVTGDEPIVPSAKSLIDLLDQTSPARK